jgi:AraC-like DNA-binding protein
MQAFLPAERLSDDQLIVGAMRNEATPRRTAAHSHPKGQLLGTTEGLSTIGTEVNHWVVPPTSAVWLPPHHRHDFVSHGVFSGWSIYVAESACIDLPPLPRVIRVSDLLREAAYRAARWETGRLSPAQERIAVVVLDEIAVAPSAPFDLPMPKDPRLARIACALVERPDMRQRMNVWAKWAGLSPRTLTRRFPAETGLTFVAWQQRARLLKAMELLAGGTSVTSTAFELGYETVSSFIDLFKSNFGTTPGQYFKVEKS